MHIYSKTHATKAALEGHQAKILLREGKIITKAVKEGFTIYYYFPSEIDKRRYYQIYSDATRKKGGLDIISPDGFSIRPPLKLFKSFKEAIDYFEAWKKGLERQGYYSSNLGRIALEDLLEECQLIEIH